MSIYDSIARGHVCNAWPAVPDMDSHSLQRFIVIVESGSLSKAAARLRVTQPALTRTLQALETHYGAQLLRRGAGGVALTSFGAALLVRAKLIQAELRHLDSEIDALRNLATGQVRVGVPSGIGFTSEVLPSATLRLLTESARLEISYQIGTRDDLLASLRRGDLDFVVSDIVHTGDVSDLVQEVLFTDRSAVLVRAGHPLAARRRLPPAALAAHPWIVLSDSVALEASLRQWLGEGGTRAARSVLRSNSALFVRSTVAKSDGIGLLGLDAARSDLQAGSLVELTVHDPGRRLALPAREIGLVYRRDAVLSTAALALIAEVRAQCGKPAPRAAGQARRYAAAPGA